MFLYKANSTWSKKISAVFFFLFFVPSHSPLALCAPSFPSSPVALFACLQLSRLSLGSTYLAFGSLWRRQLQFCLSLVKLPANMGFFLTWFFACAPSWRCKQVNYANNRVANNSTRTSSHAGKKPLLVGYFEALAFVSRFPKLVSNKCSVPPILAALVLEAWYSVFEG